MGDGVPCYSNGIKRQSEGHESRVSGGPLPGDQHTPTSTPNLHQSFLRSTIVELLKTEVHCKLTSDPSTESEIKRSATTPSRPRYEYNPRPPKKSLHCDWQSFASIQANFDTTWPPQSPNNTTTISDGRKTARCTFLRVTALRLSL